MIECGPSDSYRVGKASDAMDRIAKLLAGFSSGQAGAGTAFTVVKSGLTDPPAYLVELLLLRVMGFSDLGPEDKVGWRTVVQFKDHLFLIRDYKFGSWSIEAASAEAGALVDEVSTRIRGAARQLDAGVSAELREDVHAERYWLLNTFSKLGRLHDHHLVKTKQALEAYDALDQAKPPDDGKLFTAYNARVRAEAEAEYAVFALLGAFFSLLEFLTDTMFALHRTTGTFSDFAKQRLHERLKALVPVSGDAAWKQWYDAVLELKDRYRNPLHHGLSDEEIGVLVQIKGFGLVPLSYRYLADELRFGSNLGISIDVVRDIVTDCEASLERLRTTEPYNYYYRFIKAGLEVPVDLGEAAALRAEMTDMASWEEGIQARLEAQDRYDNRE